MEENRWTKVWWLFATLIIAVFPFVVIMNLNSIIAVVLAGAVSVSSIVVSVCLRFQNEEVASYWKKVAEIRLDKIADLNDEILARDTEAQCHEDH